MTGTHDETQKRFEEEPAAPGGAWYELTLIVSGASEISARAIANVRELCDLHLEGRHHLSVVDLTEDPIAVIITGGVLAAPTLVKNSPPPVRRVVGDLSQRENVLLALGIPVAADAPRTLG